MNSNFNLGFAFYKKMFRANRDGSLDEETISSCSKKILSYKPTSLGSIKFSDRFCDDFRLTTAYQGLVTGVGRNHDVADGMEENFKLGLFFEYTTGLPSISGSKIKGIIKEPFERFGYDGYDEDLLLDYFKTLFTELGLGDVSLDKEILIKLKKEIFEGKLDDGNIPTKYERDLFLEAYMDETNEGKEIFNDDYITPHTSPITNPKPIRFLRVRSNVVFAFAFETKDSKVIPQLTSKKKKEMFRIIIKREGLGAKTNVGYGKFQ